MEEETDRQRERQMTKMKSRPSNTDKKKKATGERTYHRSGSSERSGVGDQASQGVFLPGSLNYMCIVCHHDRHLLHHLDSNYPQQQKGGEDEEKQQGRGEVVEREVE